MSGYLRSRTALRDSRTRLGNWVAVCDYWWWGSWKTPLCSGGSGKTLCATVCIKKKRRPSTSTRTKRLGRQDELQRDVTAYPFAKTAKQDTRDSFGI